MIEIFGMLLGGLFRLAPEASRLIEGASQRKHEREMLKANIEADKLRAELAMQSMEKQGEINQRIAEMGAMVEALKGQMKQSNLTGYKWLDIILGLVDAANKAVRPILTYWYCVAAYGAYKVASYYMILSAGSSWQNAITMLWTTQDYGVMWSIIGFWFVDRAIRNQQAR